MPDHDYEDVPIEGEEEREHSPSSHLTPPVESTYSIIMEEQQHLMGQEGDGEYSRLREEDNGAQENLEAAYDEVTIGGGGGGGERGGSGFGGRGRGSRPSSTPSDEAYSVITDVPTSRTMPQEPPALPHLPTNRRHTTYSHGRGLPSKPIGGLPESTLSTAVVGKDTVPKVKFNVIMDQLRKVQVLQMRERERVRVEGSK